MGKVLEKLAKLPAVKTIADHPEGHLVILTDGREQVCATAHAARLFIQGTKATASRSTPAASQNDNGEGIVVPLHTEIRVPKYPGMRIAAERAGDEYVAIPLSQRSKGFNANEAEGADAFRRGYDRKSHYYGESSAAKEFEQAWEAARRAAEATAK